MSTQNIKDVRAVFKPDNPLNLTAVSDTFFPGMDQEYDSFRDHILVSQFSSSEVRPTARPEAPTTMIFITPGEGTLNALEPGGDPL